MLSLGDNKDEDINKVLVDNGIIMDGDSGDQSYLAHAADLLKDLDKVNVTNGRNEPYMLDTHTQEQVPDFEVYTYRSEQKIQTIEE